MKKPMALQLALSQSIDYLSQHPEALQLSIIDGTVVSTGVPAHGWEYRYTLKMAVSEFTGDPDDIVAVVCNWLKTNQPDALQNPELREKLFQFALEMPGSGLSNISLSLTLTERVLITLSNGTTTISEVDEPEEPEEFWRVKRNV